ncbi:MAG: hypothetical protein IJR47_00735 [Clostridia bacterium]|nr:hypothetical protein [Clostridia bacterium]
MNLKRLNLKKYFNSRNKMVFFGGAVLAFIIMAVFFINGKQPYKAAAYIEFGFMWLSVIIYVCMFYMMSNKPSAKKVLMNIGYLVYLAAFITLGFLLYNRSNILILIAVDFFLVFAILIYGLFVFYRAGKKTDN